MQHYITQQPVQPSLVQRMTQTVQFALCLSGILLMSFLIAGLSLYIVSSLLTIARFVLGG